MQVFITIWSDVIENLDINQNKTLLNYFSKEMGESRVGEGGMVGELWGMSRGELTRENAHVLAWHT